MKSIASVFAFIACLAGLGMAFGSLSHHVVQKASVVAVAQAVPLQGRGLVQIGAGDPNGVTVTIGGTGVIDGTYRAYRDSPVNPQTFIVDLVNANGGWTQAKVTVTRGVSPVGVIGWGCGGWYQTSDAGYAADGTAFIGHGFDPKTQNLLPGLVLIGGDPITTGGTVSNSGPWGLTGKTITISVSP